MTYTLTKTPHFLRVTDDASRMKIETFSEFGYRLVSGQLIYFASNIARPLENCLIS